MRSLDATTPAVAADMCGCDPLRRLRDDGKKGAHGGNMVSPALIAPDGVIPLETLRLGLRGDTLPEILLQTDLPA